MLEKAQDLLSFLIQFPLQSLTVERGRTVSLPLIKTAEMQVKLLAKSLNYNGTLQLQHRLLNVHFILFAISQHFLSSLQASGQASCVLQNTAQLMG